MLIYYNIEEKLSEATNILIVSNNQIKNPFTFRLESKNVQSILYKDIYNDNNFYDLIYFDNVIPKQSKIKRLLKKCFQLCSNEGGDVIFAVESGPSFFSGKPGKERSALLKAARLLNFNISIEKGMDSYKIVFRKIPLNQNGALNLYFSKMNEYLYS